MYRASRALRRGLSIGGLCYATLLVTGACRTTADLERVVPYTFVCHPVCKLRPHEHPAPQHACIVRLAGSEYETMLFGVANAGSEAVEIAEVHVTLAGNQELKGRLYRQKYVEVRKPSGLFACASARGLWPDPLVPVSLEQRSLDGEWDLQLARPVAVPPGENRALVLVLYLPLGASRSPAHGEIICQVTECRLPPVEILVLPYRFDLPCVSSMETAVGFSFARIAEHGSSRNSGTEGPGRL
jgi:hypothetical protein